MGIERTEEAEKNTYKKKEEKNGKKTHEKIEIEIEYKWMKWIKNMVL